ncbi:hypothetical protein Hypma_004925 [Hypsizygus marmoreus]|uniref:Uncharacterized protein n=1 Tax=Hypsizygus marmoreus TaxID=39966 RepID=A0A369KGL9_HYPMA|nr:hypothetical protein Hypma_004925 [Hypsizygus marmoreus]
MDSEHFSRFHRLLTTNNEPSDAEAIAVQEAMEERGSDLMKLEARIVEAHMVLNSLLEQHKHEEGLIFHLGIVFAPIRRLPRDILIEIFLFTREWVGDLCVMGDMAPIAVGPRPGPSPLVITHVCSEWRSVALRVPMLWATIISRPEPCFLGNFDPSRDVRLQTWLTRTGVTAPLDITLDVRPLSYNSATPLSWMQPYIARIRTLSLMGKVVRLPSGAFDSLELLRLWNAFEYDNANATSMPSLRRVGFRGVFVPLRFIPWGQLTHLYMDVDSVHPRKFRNTLSNCRALNHLDMSTSNFYDAYENPSVSIADNIRITMPRLETLAIRTTNATTSLLSHLTLPALKTLHITFNTFPAGLYDIFQDCSSFRLKSLSMHGTKHFGGMDTADFLKIVRTTPSLTEIILYDALLVTRALISALKSPSLGGVPDVGPNLEYIGIRNLSLRHANIMDDRLANDYDILDMVTSRDPSREAIIEFKPPRTRVFRSSRPKRACAGELHDFGIVDGPVKDTCELLHICF